MNAEEETRYRAEDSCRSAVIATDLFANPRRGAFFILRRASFNVIEFARETCIDFLHVPAHQKFHHGRYNGAGEKIRGEHGEDHRRSQWLKQIFGGTTQEEDRHKHDANAERRNKRWHRDLRRPIENRADHRFPHRQVAVDVFKLHRGIIDQNTHGERETAQRHDVQCLAERAKDDDRA